MSKALVIRGVNFEENKVETVSWAQEIHTTSIELDYDTLSLANIGTTQQLTATVLPADTTDVITWSSSNIRIATVSGDGLVTITGAGEVTITAISGEKEATCVITATHTIELEELQLSAYVYARGYGETVSQKPWNHYAQAASGDANYGYAYSDKATKKKIGVTSVNRYPLYFGHASQLEITAPSNIKVTVVICNSKKSPCDYPDWEGESHTANYAAWLKADANQYDSNVPLGNRTVTDIPEDCDSVVITFRKTTADLAAGDVENVTVVAS